MTSTPERIIRFPTVVIHCQSRYVVSIKAVNAIKVMAIKSIKKYPTCFENFSCIWLRYLK